MVAYIHDETVLRTNEMEKLFEKLDVILKELLFRAGVVQ